MWFVKSFTETNVLKNDLIIKLSSICVCNQKSRFSGVAFPVKQEAMRADRSCPQKKQEFSKLNWIQNVTRAIYADKKLKMLGKINEVP